MPAVMSQQHFRQYLLSSDVQSNLPSNDEWQVKRKGEEDVFSWTSESSKGGQDIWVPLRTLESATRSCKEFESYDKSESQKLAIDTLTQYSKSLPTLAASSPPSLGQTSNQANNGNTSSQSRTTTLDSNMEAAHPFTSYEGLRAWFGTKIDPLEWQKQTFMPCPECSAAIERCPDCFRRYSVIEMDLAKWTTLEAQELYLFNYSKAVLVAPEFQQLYEKKIGAIWKEIDRLETLKPQNADMQKEKVDMQEELINIQEKVIDSHGREAGVMVMIAALEEQLEDLGRWFEMEDEIMKAKGWI